MSLVQIQGNASGTGTLTIAAPSTNTNRTLTLPDLTGTLLINGPAFSAYASAAQSVSNATITKVVFGTEDFDTNSNFASSTFTPTVAGYYQINFCLTVNATTTLTRIISLLYKNGISVGRYFDITFPATTNPAIGTGAKVVYMNGSSDYLEIYGYLAGTGTLTFSGSTEVTSYFSGSLVRAA